MTCNIIISISSDIGTALARHWLKAGIEVVGTYRQRSDAVDELEKAGARLMFCDLADRNSIIEAAAKIRQWVPEWDALVVAPGAQEPVAMFEECDFDEWEQSIKVNFTSQMRLVHSLLPSRHRGLAEGPIVLFFAGGGVNNAVERYSAYSTSKIAQIKMCEYLDAEILDTRFAIIGPGWVKTKIHDATLLAKENAGANYEKTIEKLKSDECIPMEDVIGSCDWVIGSPRAIVSGRNFSTEFDRWGSTELVDALSRDANMYKLRRNGNSLVPPRLKPTRKDG